MTGYRLTKTLFSVVLVLGCAVVPAAEEGAATVLYAFGDVRAADTAGGTRAIARGDAIAAGDRVLTAEGRMQMRMRDGGLVSLQPNTEFVVETYAFSGKADGTENAVFRLVRGGVRAATGLIGRLNKERYTLRSAWATIGIRGTTYKARICEGDCPVADGLYARGGEGAIVISNDVGELELRMGERAYVSAPDAAPVPSTIDPDVADIPPVDLAATDGPVTDTGFIAGQAVFQASISGVSSVEPLAAAAGAVTGDGTVSGAGKIGSISLDGQSRSGAILGSAVLSDAGAELDVLNASFNEDGGIIGITGSRVNDDGVTESGAIFVTNVVDVQTDGILYLGRWTNGTITAFADGGFSASLELDNSDNAHYVAALREVTLPATGSALYSFNGMATSSTGTDGSVGRGLTGGRVDVDFGSQSVMTTLNIDHNGPIDVQTYGGFRGNTAAFETSGSAMGSGCAEYCGASADGVLAGAGVTPTRAGVSYQVDQAGRSVVGVGGFSLQTSP